MKKFEFIVHFYVFKVGLLPENFNSFPLTDHGHMKSDLICPKSHFLLQVFRF